MSTQQLAALLSVIARNPPPATATPESARAWAEQITGQTPLASNVEIERVRVADMEADLLVPAGSDPSRLIIYYHGGGFFFFSSRVYRVITTNLARAAGCTVLAPDYRLAPEHPAPAAHDDAFVAYCWALKQGFTPAKIALSGDSAGGNLALATVVRARDAGMPVPGALALFSPWLDFAEDGASYRAIANDPILLKPMLDGFKFAYLGDGDRKSPTVTPFYANFADLPATLVHVGTWERLRDDSVTLTERLRSAGVAVELKIFDGMCHGWQLFAPMLEEGMASIEETAAFIKSHQA
ncbi:MAG TPA: alpha/beta hydrolase [Xanthobacteraceae bacterium]|jgi:acetyl esterase/lipase|nr:alpha/beta hydrolase [Xanthobacteraceae bacterium]